MARRLRLGAAIALGAGFLAVPATDHAASGVTSATRLVSVDVRGGPGNDDSHGAVVSADGRFVAFSSDADDLTSDLENSGREVFMRDLAAGTTVRVSVGTGMSGDYATNGMQPSISATGRYVAFSQFYAGVQVFVRDVARNVTIPVSVTPAGSLAGGSNYAPSISASGRYVAFSSDAADLVPHDVNALSDVFVRDLKLGTTVLVSVPGTGEPADGASGGPSISADGRFVAFVSDATNLALGDANGTADVFVRDLANGRTLLVSEAAPAGTGSGDARSMAPAISADGHHIAFYSEATNLVADDHNGLADVFVRDMQAGSTVLASVSERGGQGNQPVEWGRPALSGDGRLVVFASSASNLVAEDENWLTDLFVRDVVAGTTTRLTRSAAGGDPNGASSDPVISADGRYVTLTSRAANLVDPPITEPPRDQVFEIDTTGGGPVALCFGKPATITGAGTITGTAGDDVIIGSAGDDAVSASGGNDRVCGGEGNDTIIGGSGNDQLDGGTGADRLAGSGGNDVLLGGYGTDTCIGGPGKDAASECEKVSSVP